MKKVLFTVAALSAAMVVAPAAQAQFCNSRSFAPVELGAAGAAGCQAAISKNVGKFAKSVIKTRGKCLSKGIADDCPNAKDDAKVAKAAVKAAEGIAKKCDTAGIADLGSSYGAQGATATQIGECATSQVSALAAIFLGMTHGAAAEFGAGTGTPDEGDDRDACEAAVEKNAIKLQSGLLKTVSKCIDKANKKGEPIAGCTLGTDGSTVSDLGSDAKIAEKLQKSLDKTTAAINKSCGGLSEYQVSAIFACADATTTAELVECALCTSAESSIDFLEAIYNETGTLVDSVGGLQNAVDAAAAGDKLLLLPGNYEEEVTIAAGVCVGGADDGNPCLDEEGDDAECAVGGECISIHDGLQLVGCGAGSGNRPNITPPGGTGDDGITAIGVDGLVLQSLRLEGWTNNGAFTSNSNDIVYRDIIGDGDDVNTGDPLTIYSVFPVRSSNVLVEGCDVTRIRDAAVYVGQATGTTVRFNNIHDSVTGIEIENSQFGEVYGNYATDNAGGILSFKLDGPEKQDHEQHHFHHNVSIDNNVENFAIPGSTVSVVPRGSGFFIISDNDSVYEFNVVEDNTSFGFAILDQQFIENLIPGSFDPPSPVQATTNLLVSNNRMRNNGGDPDATVVPPGFDGSIVLYIAESDAVANGTCFENNGFGTNAVMPSSKFSYDGLDTVPLCN